MTIVTCTCTLLWIGDSEEINRDELFSGLILCTSAFSERRDSQERGYMYIRHEAPCKNYHSH